MWGKGSPVDNPESWRDIHEFIDEFPDTWSDWKQIARNIVSSLEKLELDANFRIGQSVHYIILSTLDHHQLNDEPRVILLIDGQQKTIQVAYSHWHIQCGAKPESEDICSIETVVPVILRYLRRLWEETKGETTMPTAIRTA